VVPVEAVDTAEAVEKYTGSPLVGSSDKKKQKNIMISLLLVVQLKRLLASVDEEKRRMFMDKLTQTVEEQYYAHGKPLTTVRRVVDPLQGPDLIAPPPNAGDTVPVGLCLMSPPRPALRQAQPRKNSRDEELFISSTTKYTQGREKKEGGN
jgi:hypothetical protein